MARPRSRPLLDAVAAAFPEIADPLQAISTGRVEIDGIVVTNPRSRVSADNRLRLVAEQRLRGEAKLRAGLDAFAISVADRVCLDVGAAAGGFTRVLVEGGARLVYAVDAGHGQLLGSLRQDPRVVNLEGVNVAALTTDMIKQAIAMVSIDVSYLSLSAAVAQLDSVEIAAGADLVGLVKPMFELRRATAPTDRVDLDAALAAASEGLIAAGWRVIAHIDSPVLGSRGAPELLIHGRRTG